jgi:hypothetical protein
MELRTTLARWRVWTGTLITNKTKENPMLYRNVASIAVAAILGVACISTDAFAYRAVYRGGAVRVGGVHRVGVYHGAYRGAYGTQCGYEPYPPCY